ncbi:hypothetical protein HU732_10105 [Pseudomonas proteolytica]|uniref:hypothetical protein n=1 Tax=Pseudomonas proteolytica TaxID=219574 RepID=UPI001648B2DD|nr:hypothetical protein [Pseudomonas proteolytica]MBC3336646.1 hypothetical protein [Pseudomonas proteolytica]
MQENDQKSPEQKMVAYAANFFAARIVLSDQKRATPKELVTARKTFESLTNFFAGGGYLPHEAYLKPIPESDDAYLTVIIGQDGCIPLADQTGSYTVSGEVIQQVLNIYYESWFHNLQRG